MATSTEPVPGTADPAVVPPADRSGLRGAAIAVGLPLLLVLVVFCLAYPPLNSEPDGLAVGLVGERTAAIEEGLADEGLEVRGYDDAEAARQAIRDREVYGALVLTPPEPTVMVASAANGRVATMLQQQATAAAMEAAAGGAAQGPSGDGQTPGDGAPEQPAAPMQPAVEDVVANPDGDPNGVAFGMAMLPTIALAAAAGSLLARTVRGRLALVGLVALFALTGGAAMTLLLTTGLDALGGDFWTAAGVLALTLFSVTAAAAGVMRAVGMAGFGVVMALLVTLGLPSSGAQLPTELLGEPWRTVGPYLQPSAGLDLLRGAVYFDGAGTTTPLGVLAAWSLLGLLLMLLFRARRRARPTG